MLSTTSVEFGNCRLRNKTPSAFSYLLFTQCAELPPQFYSKDCIHIEYEYTALLALIMLKPKDGFPRNLDRHDRGHGK